MGIVLYLRIFQVVILYDETYIYEYIGVGDGIYCGLCYGIVFMFFCGIFGFLWVCLLGLSISE